MRDYDNNALDFFRMIATIQVFGGHIITHLVPSPPLDGILWNIIYFIRGVPILFVLCGFLAAKSLEHRDPKKWLIDRAIRILPAYWICIIVNSIIIAILYPVRPTPKDAAICLFTQFLGMNFYTGEWLRGYGVGTPNGVLWTITVQVQFFIIAPLIHRFLHRKTLKFWSICILVSSLISVICNWFDEKAPVMLWKLLGVTVVPYLYFLLFGMALWYHRNSIIPKLEQYKLHFLAGYVLWKLCEIFFLFPHFLDGVLYNTITTMLMAFIISAFGFCKTYRSKTDYTYGFYLYHVVFINIAVHIGCNTFLPPLQGLLHVSAIIVAALTAAWLSNHLVQTPITHYIQPKLYRLFRV